MKKELKQILNYSIKATDGKKGKVKDVLFNEENWVIRYIEVDLGSFFSGKKVLIEKSFLKEPEEKTFPINLSKKQIEEAPLIDKHLPVSRKYEAELSKHYNSINYWDLQVAAIATMYPPRPIVPGVQVKEEDIDTKLRSFDEVLNYNIHATDGQIGYVYDLIIDCEDWQIVYVVVDTSNWLPFSKKVLLPVNKIKKISYIDNEIVVDASVKQIEDSPEYNEKSEIDLNYEKALYEFYMLNM